MTRKFGPQNVGSDPREYLYSRFCIADDGCWNWTGSLNAYGYGQFQCRAYFGGKKSATSAARASWVIHNGPVSDEVMVCHRCDNRLCVNPDHLFLGTAQDNSSDMVAKSRQQRGEKCWKAKLSHEKAFAIRWLRASGWKISKIADEYGVTPSAIDGVLAQRTWRPECHD